MPSGADSPLAMVLIDPSAPRADTVPVLMSLKNKRPARSKTRSSGAGRFDRSTSGAPAARVAGQASSGAAVGSGVAEAVDRVADPALWHPPNTNSSAVRPAALAIEDTLALMIEAPSGRIFVADEGGALWVLKPGRRRLTTLLTPDDVLVSRGGHLFVNTLGDNAIHEIDSLGHAVSVIRGLRGPQGIAVDGADNLYYTEFDTGRIDRVVRTFVLDRPVVSRTSRGSILICPSVRRAPGFTESLSLTLASSPSAVIARLRQPGLDSSGALEVRTTEPSITFGIGDGLLQLTQTVPLPSTP